MSDRKGPLPKDWYSREVYRDAIAHVVKNDVEKGEDGKMASKSKSIWTNAEENLRQMFGFEIPSQTLKNYHNKNVSD